MLKFLSETDKIGLSIALALISFFHFLSMLLVDCPATRIKWLWLLRESQKLTTMLL